MRILNKRRKGSQHGPMLRSQNIDGPKSIWTALEFGYYRSELNQLRSGSKDAQYLDWAGLRLGI